MLGKKFGRVLGFGQELPSGTHRFPMNTEGPCADKVAEWILLVVISPDRTVRFRGDSPMSVAEQTVVETPMRIRWGFAAVDFEGDGDTLVIAFKILRPETANAAPPPVEAVA